MHVEDLIAVERELGYRYQVPGSPVEHYQWICPPCRRASFAIAQGLAWSGRRGGEVLVVAGERPAAPQFVNPGLGAGPLDLEDAENYHP